MLIIKKILEDNMEDTEHYYKVFALLKEKQGCVWGKLVLDHLFFYLKGYHFYYEKLNKIGYLRWHNDVKSGIMYIFHESAEESKKVNVRYIWDKNLAVLEEAKRRNQIRKQLLEKEFFLNECEELVQKYYEIKEEMERKLNAFGVDKQKIKERFGIE